MKDEILKRLDVLAAKLGVAVEHLWGVLIQQAAVEGWTWLVVWVVSTCVFGGLTYVTARLMGDDNADDDYVGPLFVCMIIGWVIWICISIAVLIEVPTALLNPEWYALQIVLGYIK